MSVERPKYLNCIMTPSVIRGVQERQRAWDRGERPKEEDDMEREMEMRQEEEHMEEERKKEEEREYYQTNQ